MAKGTKDSRRFTLSAESLAGTSVRSPTGEDLGRIEDLMVDLGSGSVAYAVLSFGGFLGLGEKLFALPWRALVVDQENEQIILDVPRGVLEEAPGFDKDAWPDFADPAFASQIYQYYEVQPAWL